MSGFVEGLERSQSTLFPAMLDDYVAEDNPVRAVDAFVDGAYHTDWPVSFCIATLSALGYFAARGRWLTSRAPTIATSDR